MPRSHKPSAKQSAKQSKKNVPENNQAFLAGGAMAFPAPSAQPTRQKPTVQPAKINVEWTEDEDEDTVWRRAGGADPNDAGTRK